jgi:hypothetical protein
MEFYKRKNMSIYSGDKKFERYHKAWEHVRKYGSRSCADEQKGRHGQGVQDHKI